MIILIPAYEPDIRLIALVKQIKQNSKFNVIVVDDGSGSKYADIFDEIKSLECTVLVHEFNRGKGRALKTGFEYILKNTDETEGVITADADGQHLWLDILAIAEKVVSFEDSIILGTRKFDGATPLRSIFGNSITRFIFSLVSRQNVRDTQTGLRGFPIKVLPWLLSIEGERFEYEMNMLLMANSVHISIEQVDIAAVYVEGNKSTHFRTIRDSILVYGPIFKFCLSGFLSAIIDYVMLFVLQRFTGILAISVFGARLISSSVNFTINKFIVFENRTNDKKPFLDIIKYYTLAGILIICNYFLLKYLYTVLSISLLLSKIITEAVLFIFSYSIQHFFIFKNKENRAIS